MQKQLMGGLFDYSVLAKVKSKVKCETILHLLAKQDHAELVQTYLTEMSPNYMVCPDSPLKVAQA